ncbi:MAG: nucleoside-triphosphatase [Candidatus Hodarchaeales archaeon]|jgi:nucleoside-triphosphatase THEP1
MVDRNFSYLITGSRKSGKSTLCLDILHHIQRYSISVGGVITIQDLERWFYLIQSDKKVLFEAKEHESAVTIGKYRISERNLQLAIQHIRGGQDSKFLFIDEIGILEMDGRGYFPVLEIALTRSQGNIIVIRESIFDDFINKFDLKFDFVVLRCEFGKNQPLLSQVRRKIDKELAKD